MKLKRPAPNGRSYEQLKNHYLVEKEIAQRLKSADFNGRKKIYAEMYDELFKKVPDHPRLKRRKSESLTERANNSKFSFIRGHLDRSFIFAEFASGDCKFAIEMCKHVRFVYAIDISDQKNPDEKTPDNFKLIVYDGYNIELDDNNLDLIFSDQLLEHLHPDDTELHFKLTKRLLKRGGAYIFRTPHKFTGPHDISKYFSDTPEGFHLKEWTYHELFNLLKKMNYSRVSGYWGGRDTLLRLPSAYFTIMEGLLGRLPTPFRCKLSQFFLPTIKIVAVN